MELATILQQAGADLTEENLRFAKRWVEGAADRLKQAAERKVAARELTSSDIDEAWTQWRRLADDPARTLSESDDGYLVHIRRLATFHQVDLNSREGAIWAGNYARSMMQKKRSRGRPRDFLHSTILFDIVQLQRRVGASDVLGDSNDDGKYPAGLQFVISMVWAICDAAVVGATADVAKEIREVRNKTRRVRVGKTRLLRRLIDGKTG